MKKKFLLKAIIGIIAVLLVFSLAACGGKTPKKGNEGTEDETPENNAVTFADLSGILKEVDKVAQEVVAVEDEFHIDVELSLDVKGVKYGVYVMANIYSDPNDYSKTEGRVAITTSDLAKTPIFDVVYKGDENKVYLWQDLTSGYLAAGDDLNENSNGQASVFSYVAGINVAEMLGKIPTAIKDAVADAKAEADDVAEKASIKAGKEIAAKYPWKISSILDSFVGDGDSAMMGGIVEGIIYTTEAIVYSETDSEYKISLKNENLADALGDVVKNLGSMLSDYQGIIDKVSDLLFGTSIANLDEADPAYFPSLDIIVGKGGAGVDSLEIKYASTNRETQQLDEFNIGVKINTLDGKKSSDVEIEKLGSSYIFTPANYKETAAKLTLDLGAAGKDLGLKVEIIANPHFGQTILQSGGKHTPAEAAAYLIITNTKNDQVINVNAKYVVDIEKVEGFDVGSGWLYFDLAGAFELFDAAAPEEGTVFKMPFTFFPEKADDADPEEPEADPEDPEEDEKAPDFVMTDDLMGFIIAKLDKALDFLSATMENREIALDVPFVMDIIDGMLYVPKPEKEAVMKDKKEVKDEDGNVIMRWAPSETKFGATQWTAFFEKMIAPFSDIDGTISEKASDVISTITGVDVSVSDILTAKAGAKNEVDVVLGFLAGGFGFEFEINYNDGTANVDVLTLKAELELITVTEFEALIAEDGDYYDVAEKAYEGAIDLTSNENIYFFTEDEDGVRTIVAEDAEGAKKGYVVLDVLTDLLKAYKAH